MSFPAVKIQLGKWNFGILETRARQKYTKSRKAGKIDKYTNKMMPHRSLSTKSNTHNTTLTKYNYSARDRL